jgi:hypothetical protein
MKEQSKSPKKLSLKRISIVSLSPKQASILVGGKEVPKPPKTASCGACGTAKQEDCTGQ